MSNFNQELICDICHKPRMGLKARTDVTRFLSDESRCRCIFPGVEEHQRELLTEEARLNNAVLEKHALQLKFVEQDNNRRRLKIADASESSNQIDVVQRYLPDQYKVLDIIGEGGMGVVVKAQRADGQIVAIKIMRPQLLEDAEARARFEREAKVASQLEHPNIAGIIDYGVGKFNALFIVMEFVDGPSLQSILDSEHTIKPKRAMDLFIQVANALAYAHQLGILHRDLKPSNLLIANMSGIEVVKIVDFGIAKMMRPPGEESQVLTRTGALIGSPDYMSPEQIMGQPLDERTDIYSLGCIMYKTLSGVSPFEANNPVRVMLRRVEETPMPVSGKARELISPDLNYIVMSCIDKDLGARYYAKGLSEALAQRRAGHKIARSSDHDYVLTKTVHTKYRDSEGDIHRQIDTIVYTKDGYVMQTPVAPEGALDSLWLGLLTIISGFPLGFWFASNIFPR